MRDVRNVFPQASANTRVVGAEIALLIQRLGTWTGAKPKDIHILGHSLGSHIAGYAGENDIRGHSHPRPQPRLAYRWLRG